MRKSKLQAMHLGMTEESFLLRQIELYKQVIQLIEETLAQVRDDATRKDVEGGACIPE